VSRLRFPTLSGSFPWANFADPRDLKRVLAEIDRASKQLDERRGEVETLLANHSGGAE
jgi:hypothetical protein